MRRFACAVLNLVAGSALAVSWIACIAVFVYGNYIGWRDVFDGDVVQGLVTSTVATFLAGLVQTVIGLIAVPAMALSERLGSEAW